ncbi:hypothetical protein ACQP3F_32640, partial [Escherichia coli]
CKHWEVTQVSWFSMLHDLIVRALTIRVQAKKNPLEFCLFVLFFVCLLFCRKELIGSHEENTFVVSLFPSLPFIK